MKALVSEWWTVITDPRRALRETHKRSLEGVLGEYLRLLLLAGLAAGLFTLLGGLAKAAYLDLTVTLDVDYAKLLNYLLGQATGAFFFALFAGTFLLFAASLALGPLGGKLRYASTLKIALRSMTPLLFFGWVPVVTPGALLWTLILAIDGVRTARSYRKPPRTSIQQRE